MIFCKNKKYIFWKCMG